ncbi:hypothetical protein NC652_031708 [Populus alba x Populus x berolinensis]|nr:hypothetical protein NC652_031708 [Populus alba x Populus x berolinensis]
MPPLVLIFFTSRRPKLFLPLDSHQHTTLTSRFSPRHFQLLPLSRRSAPDQKREKPNSQPQTSSHGKPFPSLDSSRNRGRSLPLQSRHFQHRSPTSLLPPKNPAAADSSSTHRRHPFLIRQSCSPSTSSDDPQPSQPNPDLHQPPPNHLKQRRRWRSPKNRSGEEEREADNDGKQI